MLILSRKVGEKTVIDGDITLTVLEISGSRVRLGFEAPQDVFIRRSELVPDSSQIGSLPSATFPRPNEVCKGHFLLDA